MSSSSEILLDHDDLSDALRESRPFRPARAYRIRVALNGLDFHTIEVADPVPLGRQILSAAGCDPLSDFSLFAILPSGDFEDIRLDEAFDLRARGAERFVAFSTDRDYKLTINNRQLAWGKPVIAGAALYKLSAAGDGEAVFLEVRGGEDQLIDTDDVIDLTRPGIERFITASPPSITYEIIVNSRPRIVEDKQVTFEQVVQLAFPSQHDSNTVFSMTYRHAASNPRAGELATGGTVVVKPEGTIFNVTRTVKS